MAIERGPFPYIGPNTTPDAVAAFVDLRWRPGQDVPYYVPVPRIPCVGETIVGPDDVGELEVTKVAFVYARGFAYSPQVVVYTRPLDRAHIGVERAPGSHGY